MHIAGHASSHTARIAPRLEGPWPAVLCFVLYYLAAELGGLLHLPASHLPLLRPEQAFLFVALLLTPVERWWIVAIAAALAHGAAFANTGAPAWRLLWELVYALVTASGGVLALRAVLPHREPFRSQRDLIAFICIAVLLTPLVGAAISPHVVLTALDAGERPASSVLSSWVTVAAPHAASMLTLAPALWIWGVRGAGLWGDRTTRDWLEAASITALTLLLYGMLVANEDIHAPAFAMALPLLWASTRFGVAGGAALSFGVTLLLSTAGFLPHALIASHSSTNGVLDLYFYFVAFAATALFVGIASDARETAMLALRKSNDRFRLALQGTKDVLFDWDIRAGTIWGSDEAGEEPAAQGRPWQIDEWVSTHVHESDRTRFRTELAAALAGPGAQWRCEYRLRDGETITHIVERGSILRDANGAAARVIGSMMDVTDRRRFEEAERAAERGARLSAVGEVTASITHELNQPLTALLSNAEAGLVYLESGSFEREEIAHILHDMRSDVLRASDVIGRLRPLVRGAGSRTMLNIGELVQETMSLAAHEARRRLIDLRMDCGAAPAILGDRVQLQQVLLNLILNSMDALMRTPQERRWISVSVCAREGEAIEVSVSDAGSGVPTEQLPHIFKSYYTTKPEGMGLGLSISRSIVEAHGGRIWAENRPEGGAVFRFNLPASGGG